MPRGIARRKRFRGRLPGGGSGLSLFMVSLFIMSEPTGKSPQSSRDGRRARALRENLKRRKAQARGRAQGEEAEKSETAAPALRGSGASDRQNGSSRKE